jgi:uncharacterized protein (TIGR00369 family)
MASTANGTHRLSTDEVNALVDEHFPQVHEGNGRLTLEFLGPRIAHVRMARDPRAMRPGGTVSGPSIFKLADFSAYALILAELGAGALEAVTSNLSINFLSRPAPSDLIAHTRLIKLGRRLAVAEIEIYSDGVPDMVAHATCTYAIPTGAHAA